MYKKGQWRAWCQVCGRPLLSDDIVRRWDNLLVGPECWEPRHPQEYLKVRPETSGKLPWRAPEPSTADGSPSYPALPPGVPAADFCTPQGRSAIPGEGIPGCMIPSVALSETIINNTFPPDALSIYSTIYGTQRLTSGGGIVPSGTLAIFNTNGTDSAHTFVTAFSTQITSSVQTATTPYYVGGFQGSGIFSRATLASTPVIEFSGYRFDYVSSAIRIIRFDAGAPTVLASLTITAPYFLGAGMPLTFHFNTAGVNYEGWLSAPGQADTAHITATSAFYAKGRIGFLSFANYAGVGADTYWSGYTATYSL